MEKRMTFSLIFFWSSFFLSSSLFADSARLSVRLDLLAIPSPAIALLGGPVYNKTYLMIDNIGTWNIGLMGSYRSDGRSITPEEDLSTYAVGATTRYYTQKAFGLRAERMLPIFTNSLYLGTEFYRSWMDFEYVDVYGTEQEKCLWIEGGVSNFEAGRLLIGKKWEIGRRLLILSEAGYKSVKHISPKDSSRVIYNPCGEERQRPNPESRDLNARFEEAKSSWVFQIQVGLAF